MHALLRWCFLVLTSSVLLSHGATSNLACVDPLIGTEGAGSQYGGMMPYTGVPFGSFQMVPMTRLNRVGQLSFNASDDTLIGFILTRQPAIWMGDWGEVRIPIEPAKITAAEYTPYSGRVTAGGRVFEYTATAHAAWLRGDLRDVRLLDGYSSNRDDENLGYALPNFKGWRAVRRVKGGLQIGVSLISLEQARANLAAEIGEKSFETVVAETKAAWENLFARIMIDASDDVKTIFYTGLYHTLLYPRQFDTERRWEDRGQFGRFPETRAGLTSYLKRGYVACDETAESVSRTQDFALADRNQNYTNLWCAAEQLFLPRRADGSFVPRAELRSPFHDYCEQQPETGLWAVPHDPEGLAKLMGGKDAATRRLDAYFEHLFFKPDGRGNGSIHGNETSHHCAYLYNRFGHPEKTQQRVREILMRAYSTNRKGFDGNEDCGQMSAWYIFSALGFYPLDPASGEYELGSPLVKSAEILFGAPYPVATLRIVVRNTASERWRVRRVTLNGVELKTWRVRHADLVKGGELVFEMASESHPTNH